MGVISRYLDVNRGEILFARAIILVEGTAEEYLVPMFGELLGFDFNELGISVCSVSGTNFMPYVRLLGKDGFGIPFAVITDFDPQSNGRSLGHTRVLKLLKDLMDPEEYERLATDTERLKCAQRYGIFLNKYTLEVDLFESGCQESMCRTLGELSENAALMGRANGWRQDPSTLDKGQFMKDIDVIGKGRFAQRLASYLLPDGCPPYIQEAIRYVAIRCS